MHMRCCASPATLAFVCAISRTGRARPSAAPSQSRSILLILDTSSMKDGRNRRQIQPDLPLPELGSRDRTTGDSLSARRAIVSVPAAGARSAPALGQPVEPASDNAWLPAAGSTRAMVFNVNWLIVEVRLRVTAPANSDSGRLLLAEARIPLQAVAA